MNKQASRLMRAAVVTRYGSPEVLSLREVPCPVPGPGQILIEVKATTVSVGDARVRARRVPSGMGFLMRLALGWNRPRQPIMGAECAGAVAAVGPGVTRFQPGDAVVAFPGVSLGAHAGFLCMREDGPVAHKPASLSFEQAAALLFGGTAAYHYLHHGAQVAQGDRVLVVGAAGAVGIAAVQLATLAGAHVTGVCSAGSAELVRSLGAQAIVDYGREDFAQQAQTYDVILDCVGDTPYRRCARILRPGGRLLRVVCGLGGLLAAPLQGRLSGHRVIAGVASERPEDVRHLVALAEAGRYRAVIDSTFPFERIAEAHARVDTGHKHGSVVVVLGA